jgi:tetratricopeptide (TPR) repeat protein
MFEVSAKAKNATRHCLFIYLSLVVVSASWAQGPGPLSNFATAEFIPENRLNESQYIEAAIVKDAGLMLFFAKNATSTKIEVTLKHESPRSSEFHVVLAETNVVFKLSDDLPAWEPARYEQAVASLATALGIKPPTGQAPRRRSILKDLENPSVEILGRISVDLSEKLKGTMLDSSLHEKAALVLAAFALRDRLEPYEDPRWALSRVTAHLAVAHWISGGDPGLEGAYALTTAYSLMNLQTNALGRLRQLESRPETSTAWNRALYARITGDYRALRAVKPEELTRLEWAERVCAVSRSLGREIAAREVAKFVKVNGEKAVDADLFFCIFKGGRPGSVGLGRTLYLGIGYKLTLQEVGNAWWNSQGGVLKLSSLSELAPRLNVTPGGCIHSEGQVDILDWGAWAMQSQRRLAVTYLRSLEFMRDQWGLPKAEVDREQKALDQQVGQLWLVPCLRAELHPDEIGEAFSVFEGHRTVVPMYCARSIVMKWYRTLPRAFSPDSKTEASLVAAQWTSCGFPNRTYVNLEGDMSFLWGSLNLPVMLQALPFHFGLIRPYIDSKHPPAAECQKILQPVADYDSTAAAMLANMLPADQIEAKETVYRRLAAQDPKFYFDLIGLFEKRDLTKAANYFEQARAEGADPVLIAYHAARFMDYYFSIGNNQKAEEVAKEAEEVGSAAGFETMMRYCVKTHDFQRGLKVAQEDEERYEDPASVVAYIEELKREQPQFHDFDRLYDLKLRACFPHGIGPYQPSSDAPNSGALINANGRLLRRGDVVVAVDGKLVENLHQLRALRRLYTVRTRDEINVPLIVFRQSRYLEIRETTAGVSVRDYVPPKALPSNAPPPMIAARPDEVTSAGNDGEWRKLRLTGISGIPPRRLAIVNGKTLAVGETTPIKLDGRNLNVRCISITDRSAQVAVDGVNGTKNLYLSDSISD